MRGPTSTPDDAALVDAARRGDRRAFELLLVPLIQPAYRVAFRMLGDRDEADDAVQEAALHAWAAVGRLRPGTPSLRPWFLKVVVNQCRSVRRRAWWRVLRLPVVLGSSPSGGDLDGVWDLRRSVERLPRGQQLLLHLYFCLDLPLEEVGQVLGISPAAAKARLYRITRRLRTALETTEVRSDGT
jgi:RNA polymerase sigma-70 factor, ECF subfamily